MQKHDLVDEFAQREIPHILFAHWKLRLKLKHLQTADSDIVGAIVQCPGGAEHSPVKLEGLHLRKEDRGDPSWDAPLEMKIVNIGQLVQELSDREVSEKQCQGCAMFVDDFLRALMCQGYLLVRRKTSFGERVVNMGQLYRNCPTERCL